MPNYSNMNSNLNDNIMSQQQQPPPQQQQMNESMQTQEQGYKERPPPFYDPQDDFFFPPPFLPPPQLDYYVYNDLPFPPLQRQRHWQEPQQSLRPRAISSDERYMRNMGGRRDGMRSQRRQRRRPNYNRRYY